MPQVQTIDISQVIERRKPDGFNVKLVFLSALVGLIDGYEITVAGYAAPLLIKAWGITNHAAFAPMFSASLVGTLIGAPIYGYVGDRFGRKLAIIVACLNFGAFTWLSVWASGLEHLIILRFLAGIGIGGLLTNIIALNAEFAAKRYRTTSILLVITGVGAGGAVPGLVSAFLVPTYGWQVLFHVGGILPIAVTIVVFAWLPESVRYLALKAGRQAAVRRLLARLAPDLSVAPDAKFVLSDERRYERIAVKFLFADGRQLMTPLLWLTYALNFMNLYFLNSWMPTLLTNAQVSVSRAALITAMQQVGGVVGGLVVMRPIDRFGMIPITLLFALGVPAVGVLGFIGDRPDLLMVVTFFVGMAAVSPTGGLNAVAPNFYPTSIRSSGVGWAMGIGRFGSVLGPLVGGVLISMHLTMQQLFLVATIPFMLAVIVCHLLSRMYAAKIGTAYDRITADETPVIAESQGLGREPVPPASVGN